MGEEENRTPIPTVDPLEGSSGSCRSVNSPSGKRRKMASNMQPPSSSTAPDAQWPSDYEAAFVGFMFEALTLGTLVGGKLSNKQWLDLAVKLRGKYPGTSYTVPQLKGKLARLKSKWRRYHRLVTEATGFGWDERSKTVHASDETWAYYLQSNPTDQDLRHKGLPLYSELTAIFAPTTATGNMARSSAQVGGRAAPAQTADDDGGTPLTNSSGLPGETTPSPGLRRPRGVSPPSSSRRRRTSLDEDRSSFVDSFREASFQIKESRMDEKNSYKTAICMLKSLGPLPPGVFYKAFEKLSDVGRRQLFIQLDDDDDRRAVVYGWAGIVG